MTGSPDLRSVAALALCLGAAGCSDDDYGGDGYVPPPGSGAIAIVDAFPGLSFTRPLAFATEPGDGARAFVVSQDGVVHAFANRADVTSTSVFLDIDARVTDHGGELGLLGFAFDPDYATNGLVYVQYTPNFDTSGTNPMRSQVSRFTASGNPRVADPATEDGLLTFDQPAGRTNHMGGWIGFGPDGKLYVASGDGGGADDPDNNAQNLDNLLGKILRLNADGTIPADNPFVGAPGRDEIWAYGLRNPFRAGFDRLNGDLWVGDVGQDQREEVDVIVAGGNYGWRKYEGTAVNFPGDPEPAGAIAPVHEYAHTSASCGATIIGGHVYRGSALPGVAGRYFFADFCSGQVWHLREYLGDVDVVPVGVVPGNPTSFGEDAGGELYITSFDGHVYKLVPAP